MLASNDEHREKKVMDTGMTTSPTDRSSVHSDTWKPMAEDEPQREQSPGAMRAELDRLRQRETQIMALIGCKTPEKLLHDLRNVLNELQLLRMLAETDKA